MDQIPHWWRSNLGQPWPWWGWALWGVAALVVVGLERFARARRETNRRTARAAIIVGMIASVLTMQALVVELTDLLYLHHGQSIE
jgi:hypothetical protein